MMGISLSIVPFFMVPLETFAADAMVMEDRGIIEETVSGEADDQEDVTVARTDSVILEPDEAELKVDETLVLTAVAYSGNHEVTDAVFEWSSSAPDIVEVDETGKITAKASGHAVITADNGEAYAECMVDVQPSVEGIAMNAENMELKKGERSHLTAEIWPKDAEETVVLEWSSSDPTVAEVDEYGIVTAAEAGQAVITVKAESFTASCEVTVLIPIENIVLSQTGMALKKGQKKQLEASIFPENATEEKVLVWGSNNTSVASVDSSGLVTATGAGQANITVTSKTGSVSSVCQVTVSGQEWHSGWQRRGGEWHYYDAEGNETTGWQKVSGIWYYLNGNGIMQTGWQKVSGRWYYLNGSGEMQTGWQKISGRWYHMNGSGEMQTGWQKISGKWYYMNGSGEMQTGWLVQGKKRYYLKASGELQTGWVKWNNCWYYYDADGNMRTGWQKVSDQWYYMNGSGMMQTGWQKLSGKWYYMNGSGVMQTGWQRVSGKWYYMNGSGVMQTGWQKVNGKWYYMNGSGVMQTGWQKVSGKWYYLNGNGEMQTGWQKVSGKWYYMSGSGAMETGWQRVSGKWYYMNGSGAMQTGWLKLGNTWYYLDGSGAMLTDWQRIDNVWYYFDASGAMRESGGGPLTFRNGDIFRMGQCDVQPVGGTKIKVSLGASRNSGMEGLSNTFYVVMLDSSGTGLLEAAEGRVSKGSAFQISAEFTADDFFKAALMGKYGIAVKQGHSYQVISNVMFLNNPDTMASKEEDFKDKYWGYYEGYKITSKKGIQGASAAYTEDLRVQHILLNVDIQDLVWSRPASGYVPYEYKGKTYYFSDLIALKKTVYDLQGWGSTEGNAYGTGHTRSVTMVLLMSWKYDELSYLIHPDARRRGAAPYYTLNVQEEKARETFEALFCYLGENFGERKTRVYNWTLGNEVNSCNAWNYAGGMSLAKYVENYAQAFQMLNQGIKRTAGSPRLFISLDHCWNAADAGYSGKAFLDEFASYMNRTAPAMEWNVNYHPYSQPLYNAAFWQNYSSTTDSVGTGYISMRNIRVLTDYLSTLETKYGKTSNSIRVILGEVGYSAAGGNAREEQLQAAALGYGYYIAMFNKRIDAYIIRAYLDAPEEVRAGLYLGLRRSDYPQMEKQSYALYRDLDTRESLGKMNTYLSLIGISGWQSTIPGFDADLLPTKDF